MTFSILSNGVPALSVALLPRRNAVYTDKTRVVRIQYIQAASFGTGSYLVHMTMTPGRWGPRVDVINTVEGRIPSLPVAGAAQR